MRIGECPASLDLELELLVVVADLLDVLVVSKILVSCPEYVSENEKLRQEQNYRENGQPVRRIAWDLAISFHLDVDDCYQQEDEECTIEESQQSIKEESIELLLRILPCLLMAKRKLADHR